MAPPVVLVDNGSDQIKIGVINSESGAGGVDDHDWASPLLRFRSLVGRAPAARLPTPGSLGTDLSLLPPPPSSVKSWLAYAETSGMFAFAPPPRLVGATLAPYIDSASVSPNPTRSTREDQPNTIQLRSPFNRTTNLPPNQQPVSQASPRAGSHTFTRSLLACCLVLQVWVISKIGLTWSSCGSMRFSTSPESHQRTNRSLRPYHRTTGTISRIGNSTGGGWVVVTGVMWLVGGRLENTFSSHISRATMFRICIQHSRYCTVRVALRHRHRRPSPLLYHILNTCLHRACCRCTAQQFPRPRPRPRSRR